MRGWKNVFIFPITATNEIEAAGKLVTINEEETFMQCASIIRSELLQTTSTYNGSLLNELLVPRTQSLVSKVLYGSTAPISTSKPVHTLSQLLHFNIKSKIKSSSVESLRHSITKESPIAAYVSLKIHSETRNKTLIEKLNHLGLAISYDRVLAIEDLHGQNICKQFEEEGVVCPRRLRKNTFTVGAHDNIDHNASSTTSEHHLHGSAISIMQPCTTTSEKRPFNFETTLRAGGSRLPDEFSIVPATSLNAKQLNVPVTPVKWKPEYKESFKDPENDWIENASKVIDKENIQKEDTLAWASFNASNQTSLENPESIVTTLPLFFEKADSPAMVKHALDLVINFTYHLNPNQIPVLASDQPIFAQAKYIQWKWPAKYENVIIMFGGLHIEKALWICLGDILESSGWCRMLTQAEIAESGTADSFLKASHIYKTRRAHEATALALSLLQRKAYSVYTQTSSLPVRSFQNWKVMAKKEYPTFRIWDQILVIELSVLRFIRSQREQNFDMYVSTLEKLMYLFFALDKPNYSRWLSVHLHDMKTLDKEVRESFAKNWTLQKTAF